MTFGSDLWDQQEMLNNYLAGGRDQLQYVNEAIKALQAAEEEYSKSIHKIAKTLKESSHKLTEKYSKFGASDLNSPIQSCIQSLILMLNDKSTRHMELSESLLKSRKSLKEVGKGIESRNEKNWEKIKISTNELGKIIGHMESKFHSFSKELNHVDVLSSNVRKCLKEKKEKDIEKSKSELESHITAATASYGTYRESVTAANNAKLSFYSHILPKVLDEIEIDFNTVRTEKLKSTISEVSSLYLNVVPIETRNWETIAQISSNIDVDVESSSLALLVKTSYKFPLDFDITDTAGDINFKKLLKADDQIEVVSAIEKTDDYRKGKKIIADKIKSLDLDIIEIERKKMNIDLLLLNSDTPEFIQWRELLQGKISNLLHKKHRIHSYVAKQEGKPSPIMPSILPSNNSLSESPQKSTEASSTIKDKFPGLTLTINQSRHSKLLSNSSLSSSLSPKKSRMTLQEIATMSRKDSPSEDKSISLQQDLGKMKVLYDFEAVNPEELSVSAGVELVLLSEQDGWSKVKASNEKIGLVPSTYISKILDS